MNFTNIMYRDQTERAMFLVRFESRNPRNKRLTGHSLLDEHLLRLIGRDIFKTKWVDKPNVEWSVLPEPRLSVIDFNSRPSMYVQTEVFNLETLTDRYGNGVSYYYHESDNTLYLQREIEYIHHVTVYGWDYDKSQHKLFRPLESINGWLRFEGLYFSSKAIITIITKAELRHMWE